MGTGVVVGGSADVVKGSDSVAAESDTDCVVDSERLSDSVSSRERVSSDDGVGVPILFVTDRVAESDPDPEREIVVVMDADAEADKLDVSERDTVGVGGGVHVGLPPRETSTPTTTT